MRSSADRRQRRSNHVFAPRRSSCLACLSRVEKVVVFSVTNKLMNRTTVHAPLFTLAIACRAARQPSAVNRAGEQIAERLSIQFVERRPSSLVLTLGLSSLVSILLVQTGEEGGVEALLVGVSLAA